jgi:hypothetical protein
MYQCQFCIDHLYFCNKVELLSLNLFKSKMSKSFLGNLGQTVIDCLIDYQENTRFTQKSGELSCII